MIAYIPARGNSKRVPRKNIRRLGGKPVLVRVIEHLKRLAFLEGICVSTDDPATAAIASHAGATVLGLRPRDLADDHTNFARLLREDVPRYLGHLGLDRGSAEVLFVLATAALVPSSLYDDAFTLFRRRRADILMASVPYNRSPFKALASAPAGGWRPLFPGRLGDRTQDLPQTRVDAGLFYFLRFAAMARLRQSWLLAKGRIVCYDVPTEVAVDVDTPEDWSELVARFHQGARRSRSCRTHNPHG